MIYLYISLLLLLLCLFALEIFGRILNWRGMPVTVAEIGPALKFAAQRGKDGSQMSLRLPGSKYKIDFQKRIAPSGTGGFRMIVRSESCSPSEFRAAMEALKRIAIDYRVAKCPEGNGDEIVVESDCDGEIARVAARAVFIEAFGLDYNTVLRTRPSGAFDCKNWGQ